MRRQSALIATAALLVNVLVCAAVILDDAAGDHVLEVVDAAGAAGCDRIVTHAVNEAMREAGWRYRDAAEVVARSRGHELRAKPMRPTWTTAGQHFWQTPPMAFK